MKWKKLHSFSCDSTLHSSQYVSDLDFLPIFLLTMHCPILLFGKDCMDFSHFKIPNVPFLKGIIVLLWTILQQNQNLDEILMIRLPRKQGELSKIVSKLNHIFAPLNVHPLGFLSHMRSARKMEIRNLQGFELTGNNTNRFLPRVCFLNESQ